MGIHIPSCVKGRVSTDFPLLVFIAKLLLFLLEVPQNNFSFSNPKYDTGGTGPDSTVLTHTIQVPITTGTVTRLSVYWFY